MFYSGKVKKAFIALIKSAIAGGNVDAELLSCDLEELFILSRNHDLAHLVAEGLLKNGQLRDKTQLSKDFTKQRWLAVYRETQLTAATQKICRLFSDNEIRFVKLKGSVLRGIYPEMWMRTSCDIDLLIDKESLDKAKDVLVSGGFKTDGKVKYHDISFYRDWVYLELHHSILETIPALDEILATVWDNCDKVSLFEYRERPEFFVFHHLAHMAYHFTSGGCGVRTLLDLWIMKSKGYYDEDKLTPLIEKAGLIKFYKAMSDVCAVWFEGAKHNGLTEKTESYIIDNGIYGLPDASAQAGVTKHGGKFGYMLRLAFPKYKFMCISYPILKKAPVLLPIYYVVRLCSKLFGKDSRKSRVTFNSIVRQSKADVEQTKWLFEQLEVDFKVEHF